MPTRAGEPVLTFSHERGFYYASFTLTLTAGNENCSLRVTLDGSDPKISPEAMTFSSPASIAINPYKHEGRAITPGIVVRAVAICGQDTGRTETHTYIFPAEVKYQSDISPDLTPYWPDQPAVPCTYPPNLLEWMRSDVQYIDLGVDPEVVAMDEYFPVFENALLDIPTLSLVTDPSSLFDQSSGIYVNSVWSGIEWERPGSVELLDQAGEGFQSNTGIRIRGGFSAKGTCPKHSFRLFFRRPYGNGKLEYPLFGEEGADEFDKIDLRCDQNYSWHYGYSSADYVHDLVARDMQADMQQPYTRSRYYHLFLNGMYWGLYQTQERAEASYAESYFGGASEDYDVIKSSGPSYDMEPYTLEATDGNLDAAHSLWEIAKQGFSAENYYRAMGMNPDGTRNPAFPVLLDEDNLIDYMIIIYFIANRDGPGEVNGGTRINNFFGIYNRNNPDGFKFFIHDAETSFAGVNDNITNSPTLAGGDFERFNPAWLHQELMKNAAYRQKFADRANRYLLNQGILTPEKNAARFLARVNTIDQAIIGESVRWGDAAHAAPYTKLDTWVPVINNFREVYFPGRTGVVIEQFSQMGWLNDMRAPEPDMTDLTADDAGLRITKGGSFKLVNPSGKGNIYYTLSGKDPLVLTDTMMTGGSLSEDAILYEGEIRALHTVFIKARVRHGDLWSPLMESTILLSGKTDLKISEISYNPGRQIIAPDTLQNGDPEFIELKNCNTDSLDISGYAFTHGIQYEFPMNSIIPPGGFLVIASDSAVFRRLYGFSPDGQFNGRLKNEGEQVSLSFPSGKELIRIAYNEDRVWYGATNGSGYSLVFSDFTKSQSGTIKEDWYVSACPLGSPGRDDPQTGPDSVMITEILANTGAPFVDFIEFYNPSTSEISIGSWYLTDDKDDPCKWRIPEGTIIPPQGFTVFFEGHYVNDSLKYDGDEFGQAFSISSAGESVFLYSGDSEGRLQRFICEYKAGVTEENISAGEYKNMLGKAFQVQLETVTPGMHNGSFRKSPVVFKTIMYHPAGNNAEYVMLKNRTDSAVCLFHEGDPPVPWQIDGLRFAFPGKVVLNAGDSLFVVEKRIPPSVFRDSRNIDPRVPVFNYDGQLKNSGERISIEKPVCVTTDTGSFFGYATLESVEYSDKSPWPTSADGRGYALQRKSDEAFADDAINWTALYSVTPVADAGADRRVRVNTATLLDGSLSYDPSGKNLSFQWNLLSKPEGSQTTMPGGEKSLYFKPDKTGHYLVSLVANNGTAKSEPSHVSIFAYENRPPVAVVTKRTYRNNVNTPALFDGLRSYDPDYDEVSYSWDLKTRPAGSLAGLIPDNTVTTTLVPDVAGRYEIVLVVHDGFMNSNPYEAILNALPVSGSFEEPVAIRANIYPNPASRHLTVELDLDKRTEACLSITDMNGHTVYNREIVHPGSGLVPFMIDLAGSGIQEGVYFIRLSTSAFVLNRKIIIMK